jgi:hypothetical protein
MTFFESELRKVVGAVRRDARYIGRAAYVDLNGDVCAKFEFVTCGHADQYEALKATVLSRRSGVVDSETVRFSDVFRNRKSYAWTYQGQTEWYGPKPTKADYDALIRAVSDYLCLFEQRMSEPEQGMDMSM